jgi:RND family efflux transporter MFP subunit
MKIKHRIVLVLAFSLAGMALTYWYVRSQDSTVKPLAAMEFQPAVPPLITTARPTMRLFALRVPWIGTVEPRASVELTALVAGRVEAIETEDQTRVEKGKLVARLGGPQVAGQRAKLAAEVESLRSRVGLARQTVGRLKQSLRVHLATKNQVAAARDSQVQLQAQLREAQSNLETFEKQVYVSAPISGTFTNRRVSVGQDVTAGQVIGKIIDTNHLRIVASIFPPQGLALQGKEATVRLSGNRPLTGFVRSVLPRASGTGAKMVWIEGAQIDAQLRPGQTVGGNVVIEVEPETLAVPASAIVYDSEERPYIFIQQGDVYEPRRVKLGLAQDGWVEVFSGLEDNQSVVTQGAYELFYYQFNEQFKARD